MPDQEEEKTNEGNVEQTEIRGEAPSADLRSPAEEAIETAEQYLDRTKVVLERKVEKNEEEPAEKVSRKVEFKDKPLEDVFHESIESLKIIEQISTEAFKSIQQKVTVFLESFNPSEQAINEIFDLLTSVEETRRFYNENYEKKKQLYEYVQLTSAQAQKEILEPLGCQNVSELDDQIQELESTSSTLWHSAESYFEKHPLRQVAATFGRVPQEVREKREERMRLSGEAWTKRGALSEFYQFNMPYFHLDSGEYGFNELRGSLVQKLFEGLTSLIKSAVSEIKFQAAEENPEKSKLSLSAREQIAKEYIGQKWKWSLRDLEPKESERVIGVLVQQYIYSISEKPDSEEARPTDGRDVQDLTFDQRRILDQLVNNGDYISELESFIARRPDMKKFSSLQQVLLLTQEFDTLRERSGTWVDRTEIERLKGYITKEEAQLGEHGDIDAIMWNIFKDNPEVQSAFSQAELDQSQGALVAAKRYLLSQRSDARSDQVLNAEADLANMRSEQLVPLLCYFALTQPGHSGEYPLLNNTDHPMKKYFDSLDGQKLESFLSHADPSVREIYELLHKEVEEGDMAKHWDQIAERFPAFVTALFENAPRRERQFLYGHLQYSQFSYDRSPLLETALQETSVSNEFIISMLTKDDCRYTERIFEASQPSEFSFYFKTMIERSPVYAMGDKLSFMPEVVRRLMESGVYINQPDAQHILEILSLNPNNEVFNEFLAQSCDRFGLDKLFDSTVSVSLTRAFLNGNDQALEKIIEGLDKIKVDNQKSPEIIRGIVDIYNLNQNLSKRDEPYPRLVEFLSRFVDVVENGTPQQQSFAAAILANLFAKENLGAMSEKDPEMKKQFDRFISLQDSTDNPNVRMILFSLTREKIVDTNTLHGLGSEELNSRAESLIADIERCKGLNLDESNVWGYQSPVIYAETLRRLGGLKDEQLDKVCQIFSQNMASSVEAMRFVLSAYLEGKLTDETKEVFSGARIPQLEIANIGNFLKNFEAVDEDNWLLALGGYMFVSEGYNVLGGDKDERIASLFRDPKTMDLALKNYRECYRDHLKKLAGGKSNINALLLGELMLKLELETHLRHFEMMANLVGKMHLSFSDPHTTEQTRLDVAGSLLSLEEKFDKNRWGNEDRSFFYNVSSEIISAAPSLFKEFSELFAELDPKELRDFVENIYPLFQAELVIVNQGREGERKYDPRALVGVRNQVRSCVESLRAGTPTSQAVLELRESALSHLKNGFQEKFGLVKIPEQVTSEEIRYIQDFIRYLGNMTDRDTKKTGLLIFFMALTMDKKWSDFREGKLRFSGDGKNADLAEYFETESENYRIAEQFLEERNKTDYLPSSVLNISESELPEFQHILQDEVMVQHLGNVQTVDNKLEGILIQLESYADPDTYPEHLRPLLQIVMDHSSSKVNAGLSKRIQIELGKKIEMTAEDEKIVADLFTAYPQEGTMALVDTLKGIQDNSRLVTLAVSLLEKREEYQVQIANLREALKPPEQIIEIFNKLGEGFHAESGALALSQDLVYLETLVSKNSDKIENEEDKKLIKDYLDLIREQMKVLEKAILEIENKLRVLGEQSAKVGAEGFSAVTSEAIRNIRATETAKTVIGVATNHWVSIIENMRQCLSCQTNGCNNDTNLSFSDPTKFYLYSQIAGESAQEGSVADEIAFLCPIKIGEKEEMSFVLDRVYGNHSPDILYGHMGAILKKMQALKERFPKAHLSVLVSEAAMSSAGLSSELISARFKSETSGISFHPVSAEVNVLASPASDHYIEFGGISRTSGAREVNGLRLAVK